VVATWARVAAPAPTRQPPGLPADAPPWARRLSNALRGVQQAPPLGAWVAQALCASVATPDVWHADEYGRYPAAQEAKAVCARCPVAAECREYVDAYDASIPKDLSSDGLQGIWAGEDPHERQRRRLAAAMRPAWRRAWSSVEASGVISTHLVVRPAGGNRWPG
jgi:hypothetical protein